MLILISVNVLDTVLDLREKDFFNPSIGTGKNVITFGVDMSSSTKIDNRKIDLLVLGKGPTQGSEHALSAEKIYSINLTDNNKKFCLSFHYNRANSYLFLLMVQKFINLKQKILKL